MISFIRTYKVLARVPPACSSLLPPINHGISGRSSTEVLACSDQLHEAFATAKKALSTSGSITLPKSDDKLFIVTDGVARKPGIAATYDVARRGHITEFFCEKLQALPIAVPVQCNMTHTSSNPPTREVRQ